MQRVQQLGLTVYQLDLDLPPRRHRRCLTELFGVHRVIGDHGQIAPARVQQVSFNPIGADDRDRHERLVSGQRPYLANERLWNTFRGPIQRHSQLGAAIAPGRQLQVPPLVLATGTPT